VKELLGKVAVVTGSSKGIGAGIARAMAAASAAVTVNYASDRQGAEQVVKEITAQGGKAIAVQGDVSVAGDVRRIIADTVSAFGSLDVLVNNAAYFKYDPLERMTEEDFHRHFNVNVLGALLMTQEAAKHFGARGCVINIGSAGILSPRPHAVLYSATKAAMNMVTQVLAKELGPRQIRVNCIWPGFTDTAGSRRIIGTFSDELIRQWTEMTALQRIGLPEDIAPAAVFLASDAAGWITGSMLNVSGGFP